MEQQDKNKWVDEVMHSLDGMQRANPKTDIYAGMMQRMRAGKGNIRALLPKVAAAAVLLLVVNIASAYHATQKTKEAARQGVYQTIDEQISILDNSY